MIIDLPWPALSRFGRLVRYASVSAISTTTSLLALALMVGVLGLPAVASNVTAIAIGTIPSFELNRRWVWSQRGERPRAGQVVPFCLLSLSGLLISSAAVHLAGELTAADGRLWHTAAVGVANVGSYGALWLVQYFLCDKVLFRARPARPRPAQPRAIIGARRSLRPATDNGGN